MSNRPVPRNRNLRPIGGFIRPRILQSEFRREHEGQREKSATPLTKPDYWLNGEKSAAPLTKPDHWLKGEKSAAPLTKPEHWLNGEEETDTEVAPTLPNIHDLLLKCQQREMKKEQQQFVEKSFDEKAAMIMELFNQPKVKLYDCPNLTLDYNSILVNGNPYELPGVVKTTENTDFAGFEETDEEDNSDEDEENKIEQLAALVASISAAEKKIKVLEEDVQMYDKLLLDTCVCLQNSKIGSFVEKEARARVYFLTSNKEKDLANITNLGMLVKTFQARVVVLICLIYNFEIDDDDVVDSRLETSVATTSGMAVCTAAPIYALVMCDISENTVQCNLAVAATTDVIDTFVSVDRREFSGAAIANRAAFLIQSVYRGHRGRVKMKQTTESDAGLQLLVQELQKAKDMAGHDAAKAVSDADSLRQRLTELEAGMEATLRRVASLNDQLDKARQGNKALATDTDNRTQLTEERLKKSAEGQAGLLRDLEPAVALEFDISGSLEACTRRKTKNQRRKEAKQSKARLLKEKAAVCIQCWIRMKQARHLYTLQQGLRKWMFYREHYVELFQGLTEDETEADKELAEVRALNELCLIESERQVHEAQIERLSTAKKRLQEDLEDAALEINTSNKSITEFTENLRKEKKTV